MCDVHLEAALAEFAESLSGLQSELLEVEVGSFGDTCDEALDQVLGTFDALASEQLDSALKRTKRMELRASVLGQLQPLFRAKIKQLENLAWDRMRQGLAKLRLGDPSLVQEMQGVVRDAGRFFKDTSARMVCQGASWSADYEGSELASKMRAFVKDRLMGARLQGAFVPGILRRPVAVSLHYLATHPLQFLDVLQDSLSYDEDLDWIPDLSPDRSGRSLKDRMPKDVASVSSRLSRRAEL
jgi:hypothetical protein